jgi:hypothetical protein
MNKISKLFSFISDEDLAAFALHTQVDKYAKKLQEELLFKLLFYCLITEKDTFKVLITCIVSPALSMFPLLSFTIIFSMLCI